jgi:hypothetical protein
MEIRKTATITIVFNKEEDIERATNIKEALKLNYREIFMRGVEALENDGEPIK